MHSRRPNHPTELPGCPAFSVCLLRERLAGLTSPDSISSFELRLDLAPAIIRRVAIDRPAMRWACAGSQTSRASTQRSGMKLPLAIGLVALLVALGVGAVATDFTAYLGDDPTTCNNCHVMDGVYESWYHGGHKQWAACGDCHTPHALVPKYWVKAESGYHHVTAFVFGPIPDAIRAKESSREVVQGNCIRCHVETIANTNEGD